MPPLRVHIRLLKGPSDIACLCIQGLETDAQRLLLGLEILRLINAERAAATLPPLVEHAAFIQAARRHAEDMAAHAIRGHIGSDGSTPEQRMRQEGYTGTPWTEASNFNRPTPQEIVGGWMSRSLHRDIVLDRTSFEIGVGYAMSPDGNYRHTAVIDLGVGR